MATAPGPDPVLAALEGVLAVGRTNVASWMTVMERVERIRALRLEGRPYTEMELPTDVRLVDALADNQRRLGDATTVLRDALLVQLRAEGLAASEIARLLGVSRQWISRLLADLARATPVDGEDGAGAS